MQVAEIIKALEIFAPPVFQESYDNSGLLTGNADMECTGALLTLDATEEVILEAARRNCNLVVTHHPIIFKGLKRLTGKNYVEKSVIAAIKNDIAIYALHTNADNIIEGVNATIAGKIGLINRMILLPMQSVLSKLYTFVPAAYVEKVRNSIFAVGAGHIGNYSECSFEAAGIGTFLPGTDTIPFTGTPGVRSYEKEQKIEFIFPRNLQSKLVTALKSAHPYEEVAFDIVDLANAHEGIGSGLAGDLQTPIEESGFLELLKNQFGLRVIRHTPLTGKMVKKVAVCGGAGSFLISNALEAGVDFFVSSDFKYHEFFDANGRMVIADIGHFESEQFTPGLFGEVLQRKFPNFAVLKSELITNPVQYYL